MFICIVSPVTSSVIGVFTDVNQLSTISVAMSSTYQEIGLLSIYNYVYVCMCVYIHVYIHASTCICLCLLLHLHVHVYVYIVNICASFVCVPAVIASSTHTPVMNPDGTVLTIVLILVSASGITAITTIPIVILLIVRHMRQKRRQGW